MSWLDDYAEALGVSGLTPADIELVLDLAREVAHGSERKNAPPAAFLAALYVASGNGDLSEAVRRAEALIGQA